MPEPHLPSSYHSPVAIQTSGEAPRVLSGIQPSGVPHLGNYLGAIRHWAESDQHNFDAFFMVADLHSLTSRLPTEDPSELATATRNTAAALIACGLDPNVCTLFVQSTIPEHTQLTWLLECTASMGQLRRMTQFKDKVAKGGEEAAPVGLFTYPVLMASDILLYDTNRVPVGDDQKQHIELCRDLAIRFNSRYGETFVVPEPGIPPLGARLMDLQEPTRKMSKTAETDAGLISLLDDPKTIEKKIKRAVTDTETNVAYDPEKRPGLANLLGILAAATETPPDQLAAKYEQYGPLKADVASAVIEMLEPIQKRFAELQNDPGEVTQYLTQGAEKARIIARATFDRASTNIGLFRG